VGEIRAPPALPGPAPPPGPAVSDNATTRR